MRDQTKKMNELLKEYKALKTFIFGKYKYAVVIETADHKRYDQLHQYFNPQYRTKDFINPMEN